MGFFEKVKNMFTEEVEEDEVKIEKIKNDVTHVSIESPVSNDDEDDYNEEIIRKISDDKKAETESTPIFFDDNDFEDLELNKEYTPKIIEKHAQPDISRSSLYNGSRIVEDAPAEEKKIFKPTPIISPVYGILDKNYHKEDIVSREERELENKIEESPIDTIRNKAYGTLEDELENTLFGSNSVLFKKNKENKENVEINEVNDDVLTDLTDDISKELDELIIKKEKYTSKEDEKVTEDEDLLGFIDSTLYKNGDE